MDGVTDSAMRALQGEIGAFSYSVTEFLRVSAQELPVKVFRREVPELAHGCLTPNQLHVQVQILGGDAELMAKSAMNAVRTGANSIDINFGCPAPTVNRNDGGATLLKYPHRIEEIVRAVRLAVPAEIPVSAKMRLGWENIDDVFENAARAEAGGASWVTVHARTRVQSYQPPVFWNHVGRVREQLKVPVVANGDIWNLEDFKRCKDETGCEHFMIGRSSLANPVLSHQIAAELGLPHRLGSRFDLIEGLEKLREWNRFYEQSDKKVILRMKQWLQMMRRHGDFLYFDEVKLAQTPDEMLSLLASTTACRV